MRYSHRQTEDLRAPAPYKHKIHRIAVKTTKLFLLLFFIPFFASAQDGLYRQKIFVQPSNDPVLQQAVADMQMQLQAATGRPFSTTTSAELIKEGIQLLLFRPGLLSQALSQRLQNGGIEDFVIEGNANRLLLVATHPAGLSKAIYTYLDRLGFRWYLPGEDWSIVPSIRSITLVSSAFYTPSFVLRNFFGTGAIMPIKPLDPNGTLAQQWEDWKRRNRFGGQFNLAGHYGETFNSRYQDLLQKNPQYLAEVGGKRQWSQSAKWCISNKDFRALFVADRVNELKQVLQSSTYQNEMITLTVDPADGYGDCECDVCKKMGTASDRVFYLANETAKSLQTISARAYANIYAYNNHAAPPPFALSDHLIVQLVPYAFQSVGKPNEMIAAWKKRHSNLLVYDYYGLPDWHYNTPLTDGWNTDNYFSRLPFWKAQNLRGFMLESSYSSASTGIGLYLAGRLGWNVSENVQQTKAVFLRNLFGSAATQIALYYQKIENGFSGAADLPYLLDQLYKASNGTIDKKVKQRLVQLKAYVHYLALYYQWKNATGNREQNLVRLYQYVLQIYPRATVHSTYIAQLLYQQFEPGSVARKTWALFEPVGNGVKEIKFLTDENIERLFEQDLKEYPLLTGFPYVQLKSKFKYTIKQSTAGNAYMKEGLLILNAPHTLVKPSANGSVVFAIKVNEGSAPTDSQTVSIQLIDTATRSVVVSKKIGINKTWKELRFIVTTGKTYNLTIENPSWIRLSVPPTQWLAFANIPTYAVLGKLWVYNDKAPYFYFSNTGKEPLIFKDAKGEALPVEPLSKDNLFRIALRPAAWYSVENTEYKMLQFFDASVLFFPYPNMDAN